MTATRWTALAGAAALAACNVNTGNDTAPAEPADASTASTGSVGREVIAPSPTPEPVPTQAAIQTQPGPKGAQVALNTARVTGDVMTVQLTYRGTGFHNFNVEDVSVIDDTTAQRIGVLRDNAGKWLAAPLNRPDGDRLNVNMRDGAIVWFKFPAPPASSPTVSINVPDVAPFDGVPVQR